MKLSIILIFISTNNQPEKVSIFCLIFMESSYNLKTHTHTIKYLFVVRAFIIFRFFTSRINISIFNHPSDINKINSYKKKWYFNGIADLLSIEKLFFTLITIFIVEQENQYEKQNKYNNKTHRKHFTI